jgi:hypothetical protein
MASNSQAHDERAQLKVTGNALRIFLANAKDYRTEFIKHWNAGNWEALKHELEGFEQQTTFWRSSATWALHELNGILETPAAASDAKATPRNKRKRDADDDNEFDTNPKQKRRIVVDLSKE